MSAIGQKLSFIINHISDVLFYLGHNLVFGVAIGVIVLSQGIISVFRDRLSTARFVSYRAAFLGPPGSGKTSAVISTLDYIITSDVAPYVRLRGEDTIENVEQGMSSMERGIFPSRTSESSTNVYRFDYFPPRSLIRLLVSFVIPLPRAFRVEVSDFAGELTDDFSASGGFRGPKDIPNRFGENAPTNFLKWVSESDVCLLFIDLERYLEQKEEFSDMLTAKYISFWQKYLDLHVEKLKPRAGTPVVLVFSKMDLIYQDEQADALVHMLDSFSKLQRFLQANSRDVRIAFSSVLVKDEGERKGAAQLAKSILPRQGIRRMA